MLDGNVSKQDKNSLDEKIKKAGGVVGREQTKEKKKKEKKQQQKKSMDAV